MAMRAWMSRYLDFVDSKHAMGAGFRDLVAAGTITSAATRATLAEAVGRFLDAGISARSIRPDALADYVVAAMAGAAFAAAGNDRRRQAERLLDLLIDGLKCQD